MPTSISTSADLIGLADSRGAHNYHPLPVVVAHAEGAWVTDVEGRRYLDMLAGYSALNFGHRNPLLLGALRDQLDRVAMTSRAMHHDEFGPFCAELGDLAGKDAVLPMNTGAEAVETALKVARKWGYQVKGVPAGEASVVVCADNFHGRTLAIISFSSDPQARADYGPYLTGFRIVPFGDAAAIDAAIDDTTVAVLLEPIQGEAGVLIPPDGYLRAVRQICTDRGVLMIADEIQSGLGRTGKTFACDHEEVTPDVYLLGKALGGGLLPVSAVVADHGVLGVLKPGEHGSTFGGNPLACAVGRTVVRMLRTGEYQRRAERLGAYLRERLLALPTDAVTAVRARGLWAAIDIAPARGTARQIAERLATRGVLTKETHGSTLRLSPPLVVSTDELDWALEGLRWALAATI